MIALLANPSQIGHRTEGHPERPERVAAIVEAIAKSDLDLVAARDRGLRRIAVLDFDVHHGNGTQHSFENDSEVFYASTHQYPFYPGTGGAGERGAHGTVHNVPLAAGTSDRAFLDAWEKKICPALDAFKPELLLVSPGFDAHEDDPLGGLAVTTEGYREL